MQSFDRLRMRGKRLRMKVLVDERIDSKIKMRLPWEGRGLALTWCFPVAKSVSAHGKGSGFPLRRERRG